MHIEKLITSKLLEVHTSVMRLCYAKKISYGFRNTEVQDRWTKRLQEQRKGKECESSYNDEQKSCSCVHDGDSAMIYSPDFVLLS